MPRDLYLAVSLASMDRAASFLLTLSACLLMAMIVKVGPPLIETVRIVGEVLGGAFALLALGWALAGLYYLATRRRASPVELASVAIVAATATTYFAFVGRGL